jgi:hypothetical protein
MALRLACSAPALLLSTVTPSICAAALNSPSLRSLGGGWRLQQQITSDKRSPMLMCLATFVAAVKGLVTSHESIYSQESRSLAGHEEQHSSIPNFAKLRSLRRVELAEQDQTFGTRLRSIYERCVCTQESQFSRTPWRQHTSAAPAQGTPAK